MRGVGGPARPGRAGPPEAGGGAGPSGAGPGRGRGRAGGGRSGGLGAGVPPPPLRVPRGLLPRDARAEGAAPGPRSPEGCAGAAPLPPLPLPGGRPDWSPLLNAAKVLGSCGSAGSPLALPTRWAPAGASSRPGQRPPPRLPVHGRAPWEPLGPPGSACSQAGSPGPAPVASTGLPNISPGRAPHSCPSLSDVTLKVFIGVENSPHPHGFPRVLISGPGAPSIPVACKLERSWEGGMEELRLGCA